MSSVELNITSIPRTSYQFHVFAVPTVEITDWIDRLKFFKDNRAEVTTVLNTALCQVCAHGFLCTKLTDSNNETPMDPRRGRGFQWYPRSENIDDSTFDQRLCRSNRQEISLQ